MDHQFFDDAITALMFQWHREVDEGVARYEAGKILPEELLSEISYLTSRTRRKVKSLRRASGARYQVRYVELVPGVSLGSWTLLRRDERVMGTLDDVRGHLAARFVHGTLQDISVVEFFPGKLGRTVPLDEWDR